MLGTIGMTLLGLVLLQATGAPDISGQWTSDEWGTVVLEAKKAGQCEGTFSGTGHDNPATGNAGADGGGFGSRMGGSGNRTGSDYGKSGTLHLKWSRFERRFNGTWKAGDDRKGKISLRRVGDEIRGALTTAKNAEQESDSPRLGDFEWKRSQPTQEGRVTIQALPGSDVIVLKGAKADVEATKAALEQQSYIGKLLLGKILRVDIERGVALIDMGSADSVEVGTRFKVRGKALEDVEQDPFRSKGSVEVIRVLDQHMSEVRIHQEDLEDKLTENDEVIGVLKTQASIADESLEGVWEQGLPPDIAAKQPEDQRVRLVFDGDWHAAFRGSERLWASRLKLEPQQTPKRISFVDLEEGRTRRIDDIKGVYEVKENNLRLSIAPDAAALPEEVGTENPDFKRVKGKLAEEQLAALKEYATQAAATGTSGSGKRQPADSDPEDAAHGAEGPLAKESGVTSDLEGTWAFVSIETGRPDGNGTDLTFEGDKDRYVFEGNKLVQKTVGDDGIVRKTGEFKIALDTEVNPHRLTLRSNKDHLSIRYIYEVNPPSHHRRRRK